MEAPAGGPAGGAMGRRTVRCRMTRATGDSRAARADALAAGEPPEIRLGGHPLTVTMGTPGDDLDLAAATA